MTTSSCRCVPATKVHDLCFDCKQNRKRILSRIRGRKYRGQDSVPQTKPIDKQTLTELESIIRELSEHEDDLRQQLHTNPVANLYFNSMLELRQQLRHIINSLNEEHIETQRPTK